MPIRPNIVQCTHIRLNGYRCGSPALTGQRLCYFHARMRRGAKARLDAAIPPLLLLEDAESIQGALMQVIDMLLYDQIEVKKARLIIHAIEIASKNVQNLRLEYEYDSDDKDYENFEEDMVQEMPAEDPPDDADSTNVQEGQSRLPEPVLPNPGEHRMAARAATPPAELGGDSPPRKPAASQGPTPTREELIRRIQSLGRSQMTREST